MEIDATQVVVALIGFTSVTLGLVLNRRGQRRQEADQAAANRLAEEKQKADQALAVRKQENEEQHRLVQRLYAEIDRLEDVVTRERRDHADRTAARDAACDRSREELIGTITQLAGMVRDETAQEAARFAIQHATRHEHDD